MILGIMSDTHGNVKRTGKACRLMLDHKVEAVAHCGDIGSENILFELVTHFNEPGIPVTAVIGNVDLYDGLLPAFPQETGVHVVGRTAELDLGDEKRALIIHGDDIRRLRAAVTEGEYSYVFTGHTHQPSDDQIGKTRVINPGAVQRANPPMIAILDTETGELTRLEL